MALLDDVLVASGGVDRWQTLDRFTAHIGLSGSLIGHGRSPSDLVAEGTTRRQFVRLTGLIRPDQCATYTPDCVTIERLDGGVLATRQQPGAQFPGEGKPHVWDDLDLAYLCGFSLWNCMTMPFLLLLPGVELDELPVWLERSQVWRRLRVAFPSNVTTHAREQVFWFDEAGLQKRMSYPGFVRHAWAHQAFSGIVIATLIRSLACRPDGTAIARPVLADIEIFDASFA